MADLETFQVEGSRLQGRVKGECRIANFERGGTQSRVLPEDIGEDAAGSGSRAGSVADDESVVVARVEEDTHIAACGRGFERGCVGLSGLPLSEVGFHQDDDLDRGFSVDRAQVGDDGGIDHSSYVDAEGVRVPGAKLERPFLIGEGGLEDGGGRCAAGRGE